MSVEDFQELPSAIEVAMVNPTQANFRKLLTVFDQEMAQHSHELQLRAVGDLFVQLAELIALRADQFLDHWEERHNPCQTEPILSSEMLQEVLRHTMTLNLEEILELPSRKERHPSDSVIGMVEKKDLIEFLEKVDQEAALEKAIKIAYEEDISGWVRMIRDWIQVRETSIPMLELQQKLRMPFVQVWLALLLGGFKLEQRGAFYDGASIVVSLS